MIDSKQKYGVLYMIMCAVSSVGVLNAYGYNGGGASKEEYDVTLKLNNKPDIFGHYKLSTKVYERPSNEVLPIVDKRNFKCTGTDFITKIDNLPPSAEYGISLNDRGQTQIDLIYMTGHKEENTDRWKDYKKELELRLGLPQYDLDIETFEIKAYTGQIVNKSNLVYKDSNSNGTWSSMDKGYLESYTVGDWGSGESNLSLSLVPVKYDVVSKISELEKDVQYGHNLTGSLLVDFRARNLVPADGTEEERRQSFIGSYSTFINGELIKSYPATNRSGIDHRIGNILSGYYDEDGWSFKLNSTEYTQDRIAASVEYADGKGKTSVGVGAYWSYEIRDNWKEDNRKDLNLGDTIAIQDIQELKEKLRSDSIKIYIYNGDARFTTDELGRIALWSYFNNNKQSYLVNISNDENEANSIDNVLTDLTGEKYSVSVSKGKFTSDTEKQKVIDFIISKIPKQERNTDWFLLGDEVVYTLKYDDAEHDVPLNFGEVRRSYEISPDSMLSKAWNIAIEVLGIKDKILAERWRYKHIPDYYDNAMGDIPFNNSWVDTPMYRLDKVGLYRINYKRRDNPLYTNTDLDNQFKEYRYWSTNYDKR